MKTKSADIYLICIISGEKIDSHISVSLFFYAGMISQEILEQAGSLCHVHFPRNDLFYLGNTLFHIAVKERKKKASCRKENKGGKKSSLPDQAMKTCPSVDSVPATVSPGFIGQAGKKKKKRCAGLLKC